jgi:putative aldouronate transport system permease protein
VDRIGTTFKAENADLSARGPDTRLGRALRRSGGEDRGRFLARNLRRYKYVYAMLAVVLAWYIVFCYVPMFGLVISFEKFNYAKGFLGSTFVGFANFRHLFEDEYFVQAFLNTFVIAFMRISIEFPASVLLALMLHEIRRFRRFRSLVQSFTILPHFFNWVIMGGLITMILAPDRGVLNLVIQSLTGTQIDFLMDNNLFRWILVLSDAIKETGWNSIIFVAAIAGINPALYEAASMDGANRWQLVWNVTLPSIAPVIAIMFVLYVGSTFTMGFDQVYNLYSPLVFESGDIIPTYIIRTLRNEPNLGVQGAAGFLNSVSCFVFLFLGNWITKRLGHESLY